VVLDNGGHLRWRRWSTDTTDTWAWPTIPGSIRVPCFRPSARRAQPAEGVMPT